MTEDLDRVADLLRPGLEPARFVVQAIAAKEPLGDEAGDPPIDGQTGTVEQGVAVHQRQPEADDHAVRVRQDCRERFARRLLKSHAVEGVFAAVAGDAQFGQAED